jgi:hypothetical protein
MPTIPKHQAKKRLEVEGKSYSNRKTSKRGKTGAQCHLQEKKRLVPTSFLGHIESKMHFPGEQRKEKDLRTKPYGSPLEILGINFSLTFSHYRAQ